jgi:hypothetical protein
MRLQGGEFDEELCWSYESDSQERGVFGSLGIRLD